MLDNFANGNIDNLLLLLEKYHETLILQVGDILNIEDCRKATEGIEYVFTRTALSSVPRSIKDPITSNEVNVSGFLQMLVASRVWMN